MSNSGTILICNQKNRAQEWPHFGLLPKMCSPGTIFFAKVVKYHLSWLGTILESLYSIYFACLLGSWSLLNTWLWIYLSLYLTYSASIWTLVLIVVCSPFRLANYAWWSILDSRFSARLLTLCTYQHILVWQLGMHAL